MIDNGMPIVVLRASDMGITGHERPAELDADEALKSRLETLRLACGHLMNLGDVTEKSVPKMTMVAPAANGGAFMTRSFIPHRCHDTIGVFAAVSAATAALLPGSPAAEMATMRTARARLWRWNIRTVRRPVFCIAMPTAAWRGPG